MASLVRERCLSCGSDRLLDLIFIHESGTPHSELLKHQYTYGAVRGARCEACRKVMFESHDHDCFQYDEPWNMYWYAALEDASALENALQCCPAPSNPRCECALHALLQKQNVAYWGQGACYVPNRVVNYVTIRAETDEQMLVGFERIEDAGIRQTALLPEH